MWDLPDESGRLGPGFERDFKAAGSVITYPGGACRFLSPREAGRLNDVHVARRFDLCVEWLSGLTGRQ
ncbi:MAG: hypothetical protein LBD44_02550 [Spirochaetaceae bacterium]|jgi:hypothetical protein|nr:hypothetical protein [Spirochaetaceae bacterium]